MPHRKSMGSTDSSIRWLVGIEAWRSGSVSCFEKNQQPENLRRRSAGRPSSSGSAAIGICVLLAAVAGVMARVSGAKGKLNRRSREPCGSFASNLEDESLAAENCQRKSGSRWAARSRITARQSEHSTWPRLRTRPARLDPAGKVEDHREYERELADVRVARRT